METPTVPRLKVPIQMGSNGSLATVEQDSQEEIAASVYALIATLRGSLLEEPDLGVEETAWEQFPPDDALDEWLVQIEEWVPEAQVTTAAELEDLMTLVEVAVGKAA
jgi:hypothetical protein